MKPWTVDYLYGQWISYLVSNSLEAFQVLIIGLETIGCLLILGFV